MRKRCKEKMNVGTMVKGVPIIYMRRRQIGAMLPCPTSQGFVAAGGGSKVNHITIARNRYASYLQGSLGIMFTFPSNTYSR